jgi:flavin reductase (DIM6/NTAB) family NADH-FMN oxidoreductase RutF
MQVIPATDIETWERLYRANFVNSLTGFKSASLIGTVNGNGQPNLAVFSSIVHIGSNPALVGFINRPEAGFAHTLGNIRATGSYTLNHIHPSFVNKAHQTSAKYSVHVNEFDAVGLTPAFVEGIAAPFVKESRVKYALTVAEIIPIPLNGTFLVIGNIRCVLLEEDIVTADGFLELDKAGSVCCNGSDGYYTTELAGRYPQALPDTETVKNK